MKAIKAPDYNPVKPSWTPPPGACDAHCHIFGPEAKFPFSASSTYKPADAPKEMLRKLHQHLGIERAVLVQASCHGTDNRAMMDAIADSNDSYRGVAMVGKDISDCELRELHEGGVRGIRFNFVRHLGGAPDLNDFHSTVARILWGTDFPHPNISGDMPNDGELVNLFAEICADDKTRRQVLVDNPTRLYWQD